MQDFNQLPPGTTPSAQRLPLTLFSPDSSSSSHENPATIETISPGFWSQDPNNLSPWYRAEHDDRYGPTGRGGLSTQLPDVVVVYGGDSRRRAGVSWVGEANHSALLQSRKQTKPGLWFSARRRASRRRGRKGYLFGTDAQKKYPKPGCAHILRPNAKELPPVTFCSNFFAVVAGDAREAPHAVRRSTRKKWGGSVPVSVKGAHRVRF